MRKFLKYNWLTLLLIVMIGFVLISSDEPNTYNPKVTKIYNVYQCTEDTVTVQEKSWNVTATVYYPTGNPTADGSVIYKPYVRNEKKWLAVSRDLLREELAYGDSVYVSGINDNVDGFYIIKDTMNKRHTNRIDILIGNKSKLMGVWKDVKITKYER